MRQGRQDVRWRVALCGALLQCAARPRCRLGADSSGGRGTTVASELHASDAAVMHFVGAVSTAQRSDMGIARGTREILRYTAAAVRLYGIVDDPKCHSRTCHLDHRNLQTRALVAEFVHAVGGL